MSFKDSTLWKNLPNLIGLGILIFILLFLLANFGYIRACDIPGFSGVYYAIKGKPRIAIVYGDDGSGNPEKLREIIIQRTNLFPDEIHVDDLKTGGVLDKYQLVIVDHAKTISTSSLYAFRDYVMKGGRLVWFADSGTGLGDNDYVCEKITFAYLPAAVYDENDSEAIQCAQEWVEVTPNDPESVGSGICAKNFSDLVLKFIKINKTIYENAFSGNIIPCPSVKSAFQVNGAERIEKCIQALPDKNEINADDIEYYCSYDRLGFGFDYWKRGAVETETGKKLPAFDFGATVLGIDYVGEKQGSASLFLRPVDPSHELIKGYSTKTDVSQYLGEANFSIVDATGYEYRTKVIMNLQIGEKTYPAVVVSSPVGPLLTGKGLVVYYAFPLEEIINYDEATGKYEGGGINLVDNLIKFMTC